MQSSSVSTADALCVIADGNCGARGTDQAGDAGLGDCGGMCLLTASQRNADSYSRVELMILK